MYTKMGNLCYLYDFIVFLINITEMDFMRNMKKMYKKKALERLYNKKTNKFNELRIRSKHEQELYNY